MNKSKEETPWSLPWKDICEQCNEMRGTNYRTQKDLLKNLYNSCGNNLKAMAEFLGVSISALRNKLIDEEIYTTKVYCKRKPIGELRKKIRSLPEDYFINYSRRDLEKLFPEHKAYHICRILNQENRPYRKKWQWARIEGHVIRHWEK